MSMGVKEAAVDGCGRGMQCGSMRYPCQAQQTKTNRIWTATAHVAMMSTSTDSVGRPKFTNYAIETGR
jgi:hypothetical protein